MSERLTLFFWAETPEEALVAARAWAKAEPGLRLATEPGNARRAVTPEGTPSGGFHVDVVVRYVSQEA